MNKKDFHYIWARKKWFSKIYQNKKSLFKNIEKTFLSGWQDSNLRPPAPKAGAITGLRYTPKWSANIELFFYKFNRKK